MGASAFDGADPNSKDEVAMDAAHLLTLVIPASACGGESRRALGTESELGVEAYVPGFRLPPERLAGRDFPGFPSRSAVKSFARPAATQAC